MYYYVFLCSLYGSLKLMFLMWFKKKLMFLKWFKKKSAKNGNQPIYLKIPAL